MKKILFISFFITLLFISCMKGNWKPENTVKGYIEYNDIIHYGNANHTDVYLRSTSDSLVETTSTTYLGKFEFNNIKNGEYYIYGYRESNLTPLRYEGYSRVFLIDGYTVRLDTITLNIILK